MRVTVVGATGRADLALPGTVPVISMVAGLTQVLGEEPSESHLIVMTSGAVLDPDRGLLGQGVHDGAILTLAPVREHVPLEVHDDVVRAVHSLSRDEFRAWGGRDTEVSSLVASAAFLGLGAVLLAVVGVLAPHDGLGSGVLAGVGALALLLVAARSSAASAVRGPDWRSVGAVWFACLYAAMAGALVSTTQRLDPGRLTGPDGDGLGTGLGASLGAVAAAGIACVLLRRNRVLLAPVIALGAVVVAGSILESLGIIAALHCVILAATVWILGARVAPGWVLEATALRNGASASGGPGAGERPEGGAGLDAGQLRSDLHGSNETVLAVSLTAAGLLMTAVPAAVSTGLVGLAWILALTGVLALRLRRDRLREHILSGLVGVGLVVSSLVVCSPRLPSGVVALLAGTLLVGGLVLGVSMGRIRSLRAGWLGDRAEVLLTASSVPLGLIVVWPNLVPGG